MGCDSRPNQGIMTDKRRGLIYVFTAVFLYATLGVGLKTAVSGLDSFFVAVYVGFFSTVFLLIYLIIIGKIKKLIPEFKKHSTFFILTGIIGLGIQQLLYLKGFQLLEASQVVIIFYLYPLLMVMLSAFFFKERVSLRSFFFMIFGFVGVYILISKGTLLKFDLNLGTVVTLLASLSWALFSVLIKHKKFDVDIGMFLFNLFGILFLAGIIPFWGFSFEINTTEILIMIYLGIFPTAIAFIFWNRALRRIGTSICSNIALLVPLLSIALIFLILNEKIVACQLTGLILIIVSVLLNLNYGDTGQVKK